MNIKERVLKDFLDTPDLIYKTYNINNKIIDIFYIETVSSSDKVNNYILKDLLLLMDNYTNIKDCIAIANIIKINKYEDIINFLINGFTIIINNNEIYAVETRSEYNRSVDRSSVESSIKGPQDAFTENYQINIGLIKKRIKDNKLKIKNINIGKITKTQIGILYIEGITDKKTVNNIETKLKKVNVDGIIDSSDIAKVLDDELKSKYPTIMETERPDNVVYNLLEGKVAIVVDTSNNVLIAPSFLVDFINPSSDKYTKSQNVNFIKILRLICFFISMLAPSIYIALCNYNQETLPTKILINFAAQRDGVPFPAVVEIFIMLIVCEILRESDLRFPSIFGSAISILGALILGEASVSAGIVSPIIIIVVALSFISSLVFTDVNLISVIRYYRFLFLISASLLGIYGIFIAFSYFVIKLVSVKSISYDYAMPIAPFDITYLKKTIISSSFKKDNKRSKKLSKNIIKRRF